MEQYILALDQGTTSSRAITTRQTFGGLRAGRRQRPCAP